MALTNDQITAQNFKDFYNHIMPYLNGQPALNYSTDEQVVGTWIDGKPLYQKTIDAGALPNNQSIAVNHNIANIDRVISVEAYAYSNDLSNQLLMPFINSQALSTNTVGINVNRTVVGLITNADKSSYTHTYVTIRYTKTTD